MIPHHRHVSRTGYDLPQGFNPCPTSVANLSLSSPRLTVRTRVPVKPPNDVSIPDLIQLCFGDDIDSFFGSLWSPK